MPEIMVKPRNHTGGSNDDFVGMRFVSDSKKPFVEAIFPLGYHYKTVGANSKSENFKSKENQDALKKELYSLLGIIKKYSRNDDGALEGTSSQTDEFPFDAYITIIKAFMQYGYYIESDIRYKNAMMGKINWKRTINRIKPQIQDDSSIYTEFIVRHNEKKTDGLITLIHEWCVDEAFSKLGWLFTPFNPHKPRFSISDDKKERAYFIRVIQESLRATFNDRYKLLFNAMIQMLKSTHATKKNAFFYGTTHFHTVWENLIDWSFGIGNKKKRNYLPPAEWHFIESIGQNKRNKLLPDTIMLDGYDVFVLDAKYYSFIENYNVPSAADINKQIAYGKYAYEDKATKNDPNATVYNAFIIPYDFERNPHNLPIQDDANYFYIGCAALTDEDGNPKGKETYDRILGILLDTKWLMQNANKVETVELVEFIRDIKAITKQYSE